MTKFEKYVNIVRKSAHFYSKKWGIEYDEMEAQGFLIYCECIDSFDFSKGNFSTYLTWQLMRLNDYCRSYMRQKGILIEDEFKSDDEDFACERIPSYTDNISLSEILSEGFAHLSKEAYEILEWILTRKWEKNGEQKGRLKPSINLVCKNFHYSRSQAERIWDEVGGFYRNVLLAV